MLLVHGDATPTDAEWNPYLLALGQTGVDHPDGCALLVVTDSAGPTPQQRAGLKQHTPPKMKTAVVSGSTIARGIVTMLGWIVSIQAFHPRLIDGAFAYLSVSPEERAAATRQVANMRTRLSGIGIHDDDSAAALLADVSLDPMFAIVSRLTELRSEVVTRRRA